MVESEYSRALCIDADKCRVLELNATSHYELFTYSMKCSSVWHDFDHRSRYTAGPTSHRPTATYRAPSMCWCGPAAHVASRWLRWFMTPFAGGATRRQAAKGLMDAWRISMGVGCGEQSVALQLSTWDGRGIRGPARWTDRIGLLQWCRHNLSTIRRSGVILSVAR